MTYVCLSIPPSPTAAAPAAELAPRLLELVPRVRVGEAGALLWADARGLPARPAAEEILVRAREAGHKEARVALADVPIAAEAAARYGVPQTTIALIEIPAGGSRDFLAGLPLIVLRPEPSLHHLLDGAGLELCGELAGLDLAAVEIRFGAEGVALWRLARADDRRRIFLPVPPPLPTASLEWTDYTLRDPSQLLFIVNRLAGNVCASLRTRGEGARALVLMLELADGTVVERRLRPTRPNANPRTWTRLLQRDLDRVRLSDAITAVRLGVEAVAPSQAVQGDLLDRGFGTAQSAEEALARAADDGVPVVAPEVSRHPLLRRRTRWLEQPPSLVWARPQILPDDTLPQLALHLRYQPESIEVETTDRRGYQVPRCYRGRDGRHELVSASGPDCLSGGQWEDAPYAWELYCCVRRDGEIVLLARDALRQQWELAGEWR